MSILNLINNNYEESDAEEPCSYVWKHFAKNKKKFLCSIASIIFIKNV